MRGSIARRRAKPGGSTTQVQPDRIRVLSSQQVAALGPGKVAALADVCVEWGPFSDTDRARAQADIEPLQLGRLVSQRPVGVRSDVVGEHRVRCLPAHAADGVRPSCAQQAIDDLSVVDAGRGQFTVSLGMFRTESAANSRAEALAARGVPGDARRAAASR